MRSITCTIVDDEPLARDILEQFVAASNALELKATFTNAVELREYLKNNRIDLLFLDINLPELSGIEFIKMQPNPPMVIFTTAYPEYAVEGFDLNAVDYLVKPISFARFQKAIAKVQGKDSSQESTFVMLKSDKKMYRVDKDSILYIEAVGDYVKVCTASKNLIVHDTIKNIHRLLGDKTFVRVHKSFVIAVKKISYIEGNMVKVGDAIIPISLSYKDGLLRTL